MDKIKGKSILAEQSKFISLKTGIPEETIEQVFLAMKDAAFDRIRKGGSFVIPKFMEVEITEASDLCKACGHMTRRRKKTMLRCNLHYNIKKRGLSIITNV